MIPRPHALLTIIAPLKRERLAQAETEIDLLSAALADLRADLDLRDPDGPGGTHFISLHAIGSTDGETAYLLLELSADGDAKVALRRLVGTAKLETAFRRIFILAEDWKDGGLLTDYWEARILKTGSGYFTPPGLPFVGAPGFSVGRILKESELAAKVTALLAGQPGGWHALERLNAVRNAVGKNNSLKDMLAPADTSTAFNSGRAVSAAATTAGNAVRTYLWPVGLLIVIAAIINGAVRAWRSADFRRGAEAFLAGAWHGLWIGLLIALAAVVLVLVSGYLALRNAEARDPVDDRAADHDINAEMFERENRCAQNHMISVTRRKAGLLRAFTSRIVFLIIGSLSGTLYRPGFLGTIGTIHFARWVTPRGTRDLIFLSNYDGSWESYLEDFITRAHQGLTAVWTNAVGFPRTANLFQKGATDGERFKRFARRSMIPTRFWYSAYPWLTVSAIRRNAEIRRGLSGVLNEDQALEWLALFGSARRPDMRLVSSGIQSLVFGGMGFMKFGTCLVFDRIPDDPEARRALLAELMPLIAFNDGRLAGESAVTLALGAPGLSRLGLPQSALATFPFAFRDGMTSEARRRILGDVGSNAPDNWQWGASQPDMALLVYGKSEQAVADLETIIVERSARAGVSPPYRIPLVPVGPEKMEPFGFVDGVSQPVMRGTYKGLRNADPIHLVEPGEFILGYPDNRGNQPPGPVISSIADPIGLLPLAVRGEGFDLNNADAQRSLGFNGSFLVIRQLEQNVRAFADYCRDEADRLADRLPPPYRIDEEFVAAKLIGRWRDGSSLARNPYEPANRKPFAGHETTRPKPSSETALSPVEPPSRSVESQPRHGFGDNDFLFGEEDPEGVRCPYGAHIRRANPRDSQDPGSSDQIAISNRHRILRVGRRYVPEPGGDPGLLFMCLNGDIERQFEFLQQTWLRSPSFHGLSCEKDPLLGDAEQGMCGYTIPSRDGPVSLRPVPQFVTVRGGGYFFLPGETPARLSDDFGVMVAQAPERSLQLLTFAPMIDSELARLLLAYYGIAYEERDHQFAWSSLLTLFHGGYGRVPLLHGRGVHASGPRLIVDRFDQEQARERRLLPAEEPLRQLVEQDWTRFNGTLAADVARLVYFWMLPERPTMTALFARPLSPTQARLTPAMYPMLRMLFSMLLRLKAERMGDVQLRILTTFDEVADRKSVASWIYGDRMTLSDLAFAASAGPLVQPPGYAAPVPRTDQMPDPLRRFSAELQAHPAAARVAAVYAEQSRRAAVVEPQSAAG